jgi:hypothetical protein
VSGLSFVGFGGSRSLPSCAGPFVSRVVASVVERGLGVAVGCASGADAVVLGSRLSLPFPLSTSGPSLVVFAAFGPGGEGAWRASAVSLVQRAAGLTVSPGHGCFAPVSVRWWAGGSGSLVPRLKARSAALVRFLASGFRSGLVVFVAGGWDRSPGSWGTVRDAVRSGVPVVVFPFRGVPAGGMVSSVLWGEAAFGRGFLSLPSLVRWCGPGRWVPAGRRSLWRFGFRWVSSGR